MGASAEIMFTDKGDPWLRAIAVLASLCGIGSVIVGAVGVLFGPAKREWLHARFMGERLRQFHFQSLIVRLPDIAASLRSEKAKVEFLAERRRRFEDFRAELEPRLAVFFADVTEGEKPDCWLDKPQDDGPPSGEPEELDPLFSAYRELRIRHQLNYASYKLRDDHRIFSDAARRQIRVLETLSLSGIVVLFFMHVLVAAGVVPARL